MTFLAGHGPITRYWFAKYDALRGFYRYAVSRGYVATLPLPTWLPKRPPPFVPYIYSHEELGRLFEAAAAYQGCVVEATTIHTVVLLLYGAGLRLCEAINLDRADVDADQAVLTIRQTKFGKTRLVPFGPQLGGALAQYAVRRPEGRGAEGSLLHHAYGCPAEAAHRAKVLPAYLCPGRHPAVRRQTLPAASARPASYLRGASTGVLVSARGRRAAFAAPVIDLPRAYLSLLHSDLSQHDAGVVAGGQHPLRVLRKGGKQP